MTCIVGITNGKKVMLGGDSFSGNSYVATKDCQKKVFKFDKIVLGSSGSWRGLQILAIKGIPLLTKSIKPEAYIVNKLVPCLRKLYKEEGRLKSKEGLDEQEEVYLIGFNGRLFTIQADFSFTENDCGYDAIGCGASYAMGALWVTHKFKHIKTFKDRLLFALHASAEFSPFVREPFNFVEV